MDFAALEIFCAVACEAGVTRAAERLQRVQSNVTTRVRQLEEELGSALFLREGKRMALTPEGEIFLGYAQQLLALAEEARQALQPSQPQGRLRLGAMESTAASRLPGPLAQFHGQWPGVALELSTGASQGLLDRLRAHTLDAVLIAWPPGQPSDPALDAVPVFCEELLLALPADHAPITSAQDVQPGTLAVFESGCTYRRIAQQWLAARAQPLQLLELVRTTPSWPAWQRAAASAWCRARCWSWRARRPRCTCTRCNRWTPCWCAAPATAQPRWTCCSKPFSSIK